MNNPITVGMPQLSYNGLDLIWLSKEMGSRHWMSLGPIKNSFDQGQRLYASFFYTNVRFINGHNQASVKEDDSLDVGHTLYKFNRQIYRSTNNIIVNNHLIAQGIVDSIFVRKTNEQNQLVKADPEELDIPVTNEISLAKHKSLKTSLSTVPTEPGVLIPFAPEFYFNGAKILYCSNYLNLVGLSEFLTFQQVQAPIKQVETYYFSNIGPTDSVYGYSKQINNVFTTTLYKNNHTVMCHSVITR
jgi:probable biosynthetic protein (TIGR04098 family)